MISYSTAHVVHLGSTDWSEGLPYGRHLHQKDSSQHLKESASKPWLYKNVPEETDVKSHLHNTCTCTSEPEELISVGECRQSSTWESQHFD